MATRDENKRKALDEFRVDISNLMDKLMNTTECSASEIIGTARSMVDEMEGVYNGE